MREHGDASPGPAGRDALCRDISDDARQQLLAQHHFVEATPLPSKKRVDEMPHRAPESEG